MFELILAAALAAAAAPAAAQEPQSVWRQQEAGSAEHLQSGLSCPATLGAFKRYNYKTYDGFGLDVSCGWSTERAAVTAYLTRRADPDAAFDEAKEQLAGANPSRNPRWLADSRAPLGGLDWRRADYAIDGSLRSEIWIASLHGWVLKYRATYPEAERAEASQILEAMTAQVLSTAGARLSLCARSGKPARPGKAMKGQARNLADTLMSMVAIPASDEAGVTAPVVAYCVEETIAEEDRGFVLWRGVNPDGGDALADRLTVMTMGPPPTLDVTTNAMSNLIAGATDTKPERWIATVQQGRKTWLFGNYDQRPSAAVLLPLIKRIVEGKAEPFGGYDADGKQIELNTSAK